MRCHGASARLRAESANSSVTRDSPGGTRARRGRRVHRGRRAHRAPRNPSPGSSPRAGSAAASTRLTRNAPGPRRRGRRTTRAAAAPLPDPAAARPRRTIVRRLPDFPRARRARAVFATASESTASLPDGDRANDYLALGRREGCSALAPLSFSPVRGVSGMPDTPRTLSIR